MRTQAVHPSARSCSLLPYAKEAVAETLRRHAGLQHVPLADDFLLVLLLTSGRQHSSMLGTARWQVRPPVDTPAPVIATRVRCVTGMGRLARGAEARARAPVAAQPGPR